MTKIRSLYKLIINQGASGHDTSLLSRQIRSTNFVCLITLFFVLPFCIFNFSNDTWSDRLILFSYALLNFIFIYANRKGWYNFSRLGLTLFTSITIFMLADFQGKESGVAMNFILCFMLSFILFSYDEWIKIVFSLTFAMLCFALLEYYDYEITGINRNKPAADLRIDYYYNVVAISIAVAFSLFYYSGQFKKTEETLQQSISMLKLSENMMQGVFEINNDLIWLIDEKYRLVNFNNAFRNSFKNSFGIDVYPGYKVIDDSIEIPKEYLDSWKSSQQLWKANYDRAFKNQSFTEQQVLELPHGTVYLENSFYRIRVSSVRKNVAVFSKDITAQKKAEQKIQSNLREKELLLKEIHHRVKNNMQVITGLLQLQEVFVEDKLSLRVFVESRNRIKAMSLVHELLYQTDDLSNINFNDYINKLAASIQQTYFKNSTKINVIQNKEPIYLGIDIAVSLGLIVNELFSNAYKYAFPDSENGEIKIILNKKGNDFEIIFADNGIGLPQDLVIGETTSLGLTLVNRLVEQINGHLSVSNSPGASFYITFEYRQHG